MAARNIVLEPGQAIHTLELSSGEAGLSHGSQASRNADWAC